MQQDVQEESLITIIALIQVTVHIVIDTLTIIVETVVVMEVMVLIVYML